MRIFVTGGTGFIGLPLASAMRKRDWEVRVLVRNPQSEQSRKLSALGCHLIQGDVEQQGDLSSAMSEMDVVVHNAGVYELGVNRETKERMQRVNVQGTDNVLSAAHEAAVAKTVYVSSVVGMDPASGTPAEGRPAAAPFRDPRELTPYNRSKAQAHEVALTHRDNGLPLVNLMPNAVVGPNDHSLFGYFQRLYITGCNLPLSTGGDCRIAPVYVEDLVEGICLAIEKAPAGQDYVFSGDSQTFAEIWKEFARQKGGMKVRLLLPRWFMRPQMILFEALLRAAGLSAFLSRELVDQSRGDYDYSSSKAHQELGWTNKPAAQMWDEIFAKERELVSQRSGIRNKLRPAETF